jgi:hypothetical protein
VSPFVYEMQQPSCSDSRFPIKFLAYADLINQTSQATGFVWIATRFTMAF